MEDEQGFVNQNSEQPAAESAFVFKSRWMTRGRNKTVVHGTLGPFVATEHFACNEAKQSAAAREASAKNEGAFFQTICDQRVIRHLFRPPMKWYASKKKSLVNPPYMVREVPRRAHVLAGYHHSFTPNKRNQGKSECEASMQPFGPV
jgi:hypothetical protein